MSTPHLWEIDHPYYCTEGNDHDMNLVFRWDWKRADPDDYEDGEELPPDTLAVYWVLQRKAILRSTECVVTEADEPAVRAWLADRAKTVAAIWQPLAVVEA
jgi:hypothetical protein